VSDVFGANSPGGSTPLKEALQEAFKLAGKTAKKDFILVFTDGVPDDKKGAADVIKAQANKQNADDECTVLFVQVGRDAQAAAYLRELDDNLKGAKFDIVDAKTMEEAEKFASIAELIVAAIND
jgi:Mg-chelatase subunit ChlD